MSARRTRIEVNGGKAWIEVEREESRLRPGKLGTFRIVANSLTVSGDPIHAQTDLGFIPGDGAETLDQNSDPWQCFGISTHVKVGEVVFLENLKDTNVSVLAFIKASSVDAIKKAVASIAFEAYCPGDI